MKTKIIQNLKSIILALILVAGVSYVSAYSAWKNPTTTPPGNNVDAPLNVGTDPQSKTGALAIGTTSAPATGLKLDIPSPGIASFGGIITQAFVMPTGAAAGKVLTSDASGSASWQDPTGGTGGGVPSIICSFTSQDPSANWHSFTAAECGGSLPSSIYVGVLADTEVCGQDESWVVVQAGETYAGNTGPGIGWYSRGNCGGGTAAKVKVVFVSKSGGSGSGTSIICKKSGTMNGSTTVRTSHVIAFASSNCGGTLPTSDYVGVLKGINVCWGAVNPMVIDANETYGPGVGPGVYFYGDAPDSSKIYSECGDGGLYDASAVYFKK